MQRKFISQEPGYLAHLMAKLTAAESVSSGVFFFTGKIAKRERVFTALQRTVNDMGQDALLLRIDEDSTQSEKGFTADLTKLLSQEIHKLSRVPKKVRQITKSYLDSYTIEQMTVSGGLNKILHVGVEQQLKRKPRTRTEIERDCLRCLDYFRENRINVILFISSIQGLSEPSSKFLTRYLASFANFIVLLAGEEQNNINEFLKNTGISDEYDCIRLDVPEVREEQDTGTMDMAKAVLDAFSKATRRFRFFKFEQQARLEGRQLPGLAGNSFDLAILGHLQMRHDEGTPIRTNYDCAILIANLSEPIDTVEVLYDLCNAAYGLKDGIEIEQDRWFEPWDTYLFVFASNLPSHVEENYDHQPYRNMFVVSQTGRFWNLSPHRWMDGILADVCSQISGENR